MIRVPPTLRRSASSRRRALAAMDSLNARFGRGTVFPAAAGMERGWRQQAAHHSSCYTTRLDELPRVRV